MVALGGYGPARALGNAFGPFVLVLLLLSLAVAAAGPIFYWGVPIYRLGAKTGEPELNRHASPRRQYGLEIKPTSNRAVETYFVTLGRTEPVSFDKASCN